MSNINIMLLTIWIERLIVLSALIALIKSPRFKSRELLLASLALWNFSNVADIVCAILYPCDGVLYGWMFWPQFACFLVLSSRTVAISLLVAFIFTLKSGFRDSQHEPKLQKPILNILFSFQGRISRGTFLAVWGSMVVVSIAGSVICSTAGNLSNVFYVIFLVPLIWIGLAIQIKRWQDMGRSGLMILIGLVPVIGILAALACCCFIKGTTGPNKYGDDPFKILSPNVKN